MDYKTDLFNDRILAVMEIQRDLLFNRIPTGNVKNYVDTSLSIGREQAACFSGISINDLCNILNIHVEVSKYTQGFPGITFRAKIEYDKNGALIIVFSGAISDLIDSVNPFLQPNDRLSFEKASDILIAHELFHYLEFTKIGEISNYTEKVDIPKLFGRPRQARIMRCSEVGAHSFAKELSGIPFLPNLLDYLYFVSTRKWTEKQLTTKLEIAASKLQDL